MTKRPVLRLAMVLLLVSHAALAAGTLRDQFAGPTTFHIDNGVQPAQRRMIVGIKTNDRHENEMKHMLIGAGVGLVFGALVGYAAGDNTPDEFLEFNKQDSAALGALIFTPLGALIGLSVHSGNDWVAKPEGGVLNGDNH